MMMRKNVPGLERLARLAAGGGLVVYGLVFMQAMVPGLLVAASGAAMIVTGLVGWCPACAIAGRKPVERG